MNDDDVDDDGDDDDKDDDDDGDDRCDDEYDDCDSRHAPHGDCDETIGVNGCN